MVSTEELIIRLALGALFGGLIGLERQVHGRPAGFRTHILVCTASVLLMELSSYSHLLDPQDPAYVRVDPGRIAAGAITGIGFIGAGVILKLGANVHGLTTAASLWMASAIGLATGIGMYKESSAAFAITITSLLVLRVFERFIPHDVTKVLRVVANCEVTDIAIFEVLAKHRGTVQGIDYEAERNGRCIFTIKVAFKGFPTGKAPLREVMQAVVAMAGVNEASLKSR
jgi:putative Mg2+ transporter-C (MgtC) family protein